MPDSPQPLRILVVRTWTEPLASLRALFRAAGYKARLYLVDIEPALNAALERSTFHIVLYDPNTPGVSRDILDARMREHRSSIPVVTFTEPERIVEDIRNALRTHAN
jgi:DNA-binding NtrC family response regulator